MVAYAPVSCLLHFHTQLENTPPDLSKLTNVKNDVVKKSESIELVKQKLIILILVI